MASFRLTLASVSKMKHRLFRCICFLFAFSAFANAAQNLLPPEVAFKPSARALDDRTIEVRFEIAKGYYLYRDKFRFAAEPTNVKFGEPVLPIGKEKDDDTFGKVQVYYKEVLIRLPVERTSPLKQ